MPIHESKWFTKRDASVIAKFFKWHIELDYFTNNVLTTEVVSWKPCMNMVRITPTLTLVKGESHLHASTTVPSLVES